MVVGEVARIGDAADDIHLRRNAYLRYVQLFQRLFILPHAQIQRRKLPAYGTGELVVAARGEHAQPREQQPGRQLKIPPAGSRKAPVPDIKHFDEMVLLRAQFPACAGKEVHCLFVVPLNEMVNAQIGYRLFEQVRFFERLKRRILGAYENMSGMTIDYAKYMIITITCCALCSLLFIVMTKYVFKPDMKKLISLDTGGLDTEGALRLNKVQKIVLGFLFALVVLLLLPNILPATSGIARFFKTIGNTGICMLLVTVMCLLKVDGKPLLRFKTMVDSGVTWGIILILAVVMPLSHAMANDESGITKFLMALMTPFFGNESSLVFALCMGFFATVLTQFMNNGATGIALMPVVYSYCTGMNVPPELAIIMVVMGVHIAFLTPAASASASLLHGNEWSNTKAIWRTVSIVILATWATISAIVVALGVALF